MNKIFLGGTCNNSTWREELIPKLITSYFNPVVEDWTPECQAIEEEEKNICSIHLYVITSQMTGVFSIAEMIVSAYDMAKDTYIQVIPEGFDEFQIKSLKATLALANKVGAFTYMDSSMDKLADALNLDY